MTLKALGELAGGLKQTRLTNWEQGVRTPVPEEIKSLAEALDVSPAYLMCLSDEKQFQVKSPSQLIPLLDHYQACDAKKHTNTNKNQQESETITVSISSAFLPDLSVDAFALEIMDDSMMPEFRLNDILVIDPAVSPKPSKYVAVKIGNSMEVIICQYKKLSYTSPEFELHTLNENWPNIKAEDGLEIEIIGTVMQNIRTC
ncbi:XRE family transcriptional regulator [Legionella resiliens]|uniref:helix-turn-helix domain-containing protein n=1 Tax=Legionella resiliens TaxID=2905958 RepID=UPI0030EC684D